MNFDVFISYANQDKATADAACAQLEAEGIRCWIAPRDVAPGAEWAEAIVDAIDHCRVMVLIFSSSTNASRQIRREVQRGFDREVPVVPFRIENVPPEKALAYYIESVHWLDALTPPLEQHLKKLSETVRPFAQSKLSGEKENEERALREAETRRRAEEEQRQQEEEYRRKAALEDERQRLEREATATREAEERGRQAAAAAEAERQRLERDAAAKREAEEKARQEEQLKKEEDEKRREEAEAEWRAERERAFAAAKRDDSVLAVDKFLDTYPDSNLAEEARAFRALLLARDEAHGNAMASDAPAVLKAFLQTYPMGTQSDAVRQKLRRLEPPTVGRPRLIAGVLGAGIAIAIGVWVVVRPPSIVVTALSPENERALKPKDNFRECEKCPEMIVVPAGSFTMGSPAKEEGRNANESPQHGVTFTRQFAVGKFAVTFDEWDACVAAAGCNGYKPADQGWGRDRRPVIYVSWNDAKAYAAWLSAKTGKAYRLLSEAEREYVTRAGTMTPYWWGSSISNNQANYGTYRSQTVPVDTFQPNPWGLYQVHGNVTDWVEDCAYSSYSGAPTDGSAWVANNCSQRVVRGGSWTYSPQDLRSASRHGITPDGRNIGVGFRVGRTLTP